MNKLAQKALYKKIKESSIKNGNRKRACKMAKKLPLFDLVGGEVVIAANRII